MQSKDRKQSKGGINWNTENRKSKKPVPKKHTMELKEPEWCPVCDFSLDGEGKCRNCIEKAAIARIERNSHNREQAERDNKLKRIIGERCFNDYTLEKFDDKEKIQACSGFPDCNLFFFGGAGTGKSHLAVALMRKLPNAIITTSIDLLRDFRSCGSVAKEKEFIQKYSNRPLLIDDLGAEKTTEFSYASIYEIINKRWGNNSTGLIVTTNLGITALGNHLGDTRVTSRLIGMGEAIRFEGEDRRLK